MKACLHAAVNHAEGRFGKDRVVTAPRLALGN